MINLLLDNKLRSVESDSNVKLAIDGNTENCPKIGNNNNKSFEIKSYPSKDGTTLYFDCPGFGDSRGFLH